MDGQTIAPGKIRQFGNFMRAIERPQLGRVGQTDHSRLGGMEITSPAQHFPKIGNLDFTICAVHWNDSESLVQEPRGIAFIRFDMRMSVAENTVVRRTKTADSQTICGSAIADTKKKGLAVGFE